MAWNTIALVFCTFSESLFISSHSVIFFNSVFMLVTAVSPSIVPHKVVSSAYVSNEIKFATGLCDIVNIYYEEQGA